MSVKIRHICHDRLTIWQLNNDLHLWPHWYTAGLCIKLPVIMTYMVSSLWSLSQYAMLLSWRRQLQMLLSWRRQIQCYSPEADKFKCHYPEGDTFKCYYPEGDKFNDVEIYQNIGFDKNTHEFCGAWSAFNTFPWKTSVACYLSHVMRVIGDTQDNFSVIKVTKSKQPTHMVSIKKPVTSTQYI